MQAQPQSNLAARISRASISGPPAAQPAQRTPESPTTTSLDNALGLAHDAGNLLAALGLYCELLSVPGVLRPEHQHYATELNLISDRSSVLIHRLLTTPGVTPPNAAQPTPTAPLPLPPMSLRGRRTSDTPGTPSSHTPPDPVEMLHRMAPVLQRIAAAAAVVTVTYPPSLPPLDVPSEVIERITVNLVRNAAAAIRYQRCEFETNIANASTAPPPGQILVNLAVVAGRVQLTVEDNGPGMPTAIVASYLQPTPLPEGANCGFGHRIIHELVDSTHGQISIRVRPNRGTLICLEWPIPGSAPDAHCDRTRPPSQLSRSHQ